MKLPPLKTKENIKLLEIIRGMLLYDPQFRKSVTYISNILSCVVSPQENQHSRSKISIIGHPAVGKTSILMRYCEEFNQFTDPTHGYDLRIVKKFNTKFEIIDTTGQESFREIVKGYTKNSTACLIVFENESEEMLKDFARIAEGIPLVYFVQNKIDVNRISEKIQLTLLKKKFNDLNIIDLFYCSAKTGNNINFIFEKIFDDITEFEIKEARRDRKDPIILKSVIPDNNTNTKKYWC